MHETAKYQRAEVKTHKVNNDHWHGAALPSVPATQFATQFATTCRDSFHAAVNAHRQPACVYSAVMHVLVARLEQKSEDEISWDGAHRSGVTTNIDHIEAICSDHPRAFRSTMLEPSSVTPRPRSGKEASQGLVIASWLGDHKQPLGSPSYEVWRPAKQKEQRS